MNKERLIMISNVLEISATEEIQYLNGIYKTTEGKNIAACPFYAFRFTKDCQIKYLDKSIKHNTLDRAFPEYSNTKQFNHTYSIDIQALKNCQTNREEFVKVGKSHFNTKYLLDCLTFLNTNIIYIDNEPATSACYMFNDNNEDCILLPVRFNNSYQSTCTIVSSEEITVIKMLREANIKQKQMVNFLECIDDYGIFITNRDLLKKHLNDLGIKGE